MGRVILRGMAVLLCVVGGCLCRRPPRFRLSLTGRLQFGNTVVVAGVQAEGARLPRRWLQSPSHRSQEPAAMTVSQITPPAPRADALAAHAYCLPVVRELAGPVADPARDPPW